MFPQLGPAIAVALSSATFLVTSLILGTADQSFLDYGWRVPFLISIVLVGAGLYVRLRIEETLVFRAAQWQQPTTHTPLREAFTQAPREILLAAGTLTNGVCPVLHRLDLSHQLRHQSHRCSVAIGILLCALSLLSLVCAAALPETKDHELRQTQPSTAAIR
jgi:MFS family permease